MWEIFFLQGHTLSTAGDDLSVLVEALDNTIF
jgi:hypothetical protein